jgi:hypothetical protein
MTREPSEILAARLRTAFDLFDAGVALKREQLRRERPDLGPEELERRLVAWLRTRPGAEHGDAEGRALSWPLPGRDA